LEEIYLLEKEEEEFGGSLGRQFVKEPSSQKSVVCVIPFIS